VTATSTLAARNARIHVEPDDDPDLSWLDQSEDEMGEGWEDLAHKRKATYGDYWYMTGIYATAEVWREYSNGGGQWVADARSAGLWGVESDSDQSYINEVANEQLNDLLTILTDLGIDAETARIAVDAARP
jgi:hypothetical protein